MIYKKEQNNKLTKPVTLYTLQFINIRFCSQNESYSTEIDTKLGNN